LKAITEKNLPPKLNHIHGMKDIFQIHFSANSDYNPSKEKEQGEEFFHSPFECPITRLPVNGSHKFSALTSCGHVFSARGLTATSFKNPTCYVCQKAYTTSQVLPLNPTSEELSVLKGKLKERKKLLKRERKEKRKTRPAPKTQDGESAKKRKVVPEAEPSVSKVIKQSTLAVKLAMQEVNEQHDNKKKSSEAYRSIFSTGNDNQGVYTTGIFRM